MIIPTKSVAAPPRPGAPGAGSFLRGTRPSHSRYLVNLADAKRKQQPCETAQKAEGAEKGAADSDTGDRGKACGGMAIALSFERQQSRRNGQADLVQVPI